jgi:DNA polymerase-3 subunit epsilon
MREIVLDTETTGFDPYDGHRLVEIGCVELMNLVPTGRHLHIYLNPERDVPAEAAAVHGLTQKFLADKPLFTQEFVKLLDFVEDAQLVIHNAEFDLRFLNYELKTVGHPGLKNKVVDTLFVCRQKFPGSPATLDALCRRFGIDNSGRELHGALLDSQLLAEVYLELMGGRQHGLGLVDEVIAVPVSTLASRERKERAPRLYPPSLDELAAHAGMVSKLTGAVWKEYEATPLP